MSGRLWGILLILAVLFVASATAFRQCESEVPQIAAPAAVSVGKEPATLRAEVSDAGSGLRSLRATLVHAEGEATLLELRFPAGALALSGPEASGELEIAIDAGALGLVEGSAQLRLEARDRAWREGFSGNRGVVEIPVDIDLTPPRLRLERGIHYLQRGGSGALRYRVEGADGTGARDGVQVGERWFPGVPMDDAGARVALYAIAVDAPKPVSVYVTAVDAAGNRARSELAARVKERAFAEDTIRLPERFLEGKVVELAGDLGIPAEDRVAAFRDINERVRGENEAAIREAAATTEARALFDGAFDQMANSQVTSRFAERRSYVVDGETVSRATHFGYDLASTSFAPVRASNSGIVRFSGPLGIYGNCVIVDHGLGLSSLYGHLSSLDVAAGDSVERGALLGSSGATGLAGGDHLHFALLVHGVYVDPIEWWDAKWVREHITPHLVRAPGGLPGGDERLTQ